MRAYAADRHGGLSELSLRELPMPIAGAGQARIRVHAAAVNPADLKVLERRDGGSFLHASRFPLILGFDFSGTIERVDPSSPWRPGDDVYGFLPYSPWTRGGTFAEYVVADVGTFGRKPLALTHAEAAAAATTAVSALQALRDHGRIGPGSTVLINGASGGVGSYAVQIAALLGARVTATASAAKLAYVAGLGAARVLDYRTTRLAELPDRFDMVLDVASTSSFGECGHLVRRGGSFVTLVPSPSLAVGMARAALTGKRCAWLIVKARGADLDQLAAWFEARTLVPAVDRTYPLAELPAALAHLRSGEARGKIAIAI